jgi:hypothetical protein
VHTPVTDGRPDRVALARSSRPCSAAVRLPTSRIGCIRALHRISSVGTGDIDDAARRVNELLNGTGAHPVLERHDGEPWHVHFHAAGQQPTTDGWAAGWATGLAIVLGGQRWTASASALCRAATGCTWTRRATAASASARPRARTG